MLISFSFAGLYQTLGLIPIFPILHAAGWETFQLPPNRRAWAICAGNMGVTLVSDYLYILGEHCARRWSVAHVTLSNAQNESDA